jgi:hypothetical protein
MSSVEPEIDRHIFTLQTPKSHDIRRDDLDWHSNKHSLSLSPTFTKRIANHAGAVAKCKWSTTKVNIPLARKRRDRSRIVHKCELGHVDPECCRKE